MSILDWLRGKKKAKQYISPPFVVESPSKQAQSQEALPAKEAKPAISTSGQDKRELPSSYPAPHPGDKPHPRLLQKYTCDSCSKPLHPRSGGIVVSLGVAYSESSRYVCYWCGTVSCFECSAKAFKEPSWINASWRAICQKCGHEMVYG
jgi:hypothetical protein